ncbi:hypothetical protein D3C78_1652000 [compost metagenome]
MIGEQQNRSAEIIGREPALRHRLHLVMLLQNERAEGAEIHGGRSRIGILAEEQAVDDPVNPEIVGLLDQHGFYSSKPDSEIGASWCPLFLLPAGEKSAAAG